jgi:hypothetical protein
MEVLPGAMVANRVVESGLLTVNRTDIAVVRRKLTALSVLRPDGTALLSPSWVLGSAAFGLTAPVTGTYTIVLDPYCDYTGSPTVSLS